MPKRLIITQVCFHISAGLIVLFAIASAVLMVLIGNGLGSMMSEVGHQMKPGNGFPNVFGAYSQQFSLFSIAGFVVAGLAILFAVFIEVVSWGLRKMAYWAWVTGIVVCGLLIMSGLHNLVGLVLGGLALWGLVDPETVAAFKPVHVNHADEVDLSDKE